MVRHAATLVGTALLAACTHGEPWSFSAPLPEGPSAPGTPLRITWNPLLDATPSWLPDGSGILYVAARGDRFGDSCLMRIPPDGGSARTMLCYPVFAEPPNDSLRVLGWAALSPGGRLVYTTTTSRRVVAGRVRQLSWAQGFADTRDHRHVAAPLALFGGRFLEGASFLRWLDETRFVYRADFLGIFPPDSVISGRFLVLAELGDSALARAFIPGTDHASSVAVLAPDTIAFTRNHDSRVIALALSTGDTATLFDLGPGMIVRDLHAAGGRLVAVTGGFTAWVWAQSFQDTIQLDRGGDLWLLDRSAGTAAQLSTDGRAYRQPALSPDGRRVVAVSGGDLYTFTVPQAPSRNSASGHAGAAARWWQAPPSPEP